MDLPLLTIIINKVYIFSREKLKHPTWGDVKNV